MWCKNLKLGDKNTKSKAIHSRTHGSVASMVWVQPRSHEASTCPLNISLPMSGLSISIQEPDALITTQRIISGRKNFKPFFVSRTTSFSNFLSFSSVFLLYDIWATRQLDKQSLCRLSTRQLVNKTKSKMMSTSQTTCPSGYQGTNALPPKSMIQLNCYTIIG